MERTTKPSLNPFKYSPSQLRKMLVSGLGFFLTIVAAMLANNLIPIGWLPWVNVVFGVAGTYGVFALSNDPPGEIEPQREP